MSPAMVQAKAELQKQVSNDPQKLASGQYISQAQADAELARQQALQNPQANPFNVGQLSGLPGDDALNVQQQLYNQNVQQQQALNRPNEVNPLGSSKYVTDPTTGQVTRVSTVGNMSDEQVNQAGQGQAQRFLGQQGTDLGLQGVVNNNLMPQLQGMLSKPMDWSQFSPTARPEDFGKERDQTTQANYDRAMSLLQPQIEQQRQQFEQDQASRGLKAGSGEQYDRNYRAFDRNRNDAMQSAAFNAMQAGNSEQQRLFQNSLASRADQVQSAQQQRAQPGQDIAGLQGLMSQFQMPSFQGTAGINVPTVDAANMWLQNEAFKHGGGGGGGGGADPFGLANLNNQAQMDRLNSSQQFAAQQSAADRQWQTQQANANKPTAGSVLGGIGSQFLQGALGAAGQSFGQGLFGAPSTSTSSGSSGGNLFGFKLW